MTLGWIRGEREGEGREREEGGEEEEERERRGETPSAEAARVARRPPSVAASPARALPAGVGPGPDWVPLGPSTTLLGQLLEARAAGNNYAPGRVSGRVSCLAVSPDAQRIYAGTANGGVWYSGDGGMSWLPLDTYEAHSSLDDRIRLAALSIGAIYVLFGAGAAQDRVFVACGEASDSAAAYGQSQHVGVGMRSAGDGVATGPAPAVEANAVANPWTRDTSPGADALVGQVIRRIAVKTTGGAAPAIAKMFLATSAGVFVKDFTVAAPSWTRIVNDGVWDLAWDGTRLWVAHDRALRVSTNEGASFDDVALPDNFGPTMPGAGPPVRPDFGRLALALLPGASGVYVVGGGGRLWRAVGASPVVPAVPITGLRYDTFGVRDSNPSADTSYYAIALTAWSTTPPVEVVLVGGTETFDLVTIATPAAASPAGVLTDIRQDVHADFHDLVNVTAGGIVRVFAANDGGVFRSDNAAAPGSFGSRNDGLAVLEPYFIAVSPLAEGIVLIGTQDNGALWSSDHETWTNVLFGDAGGVAIDPADSRRIAAQYTSASWRVSRNDQRIQWFHPPSTAALAPLSATDRQAVVLRFTNANKEESDGSQFYSSSSAIVQRTTGKTLLAIGTLRPWISDDWGATWKTLPSNTDPSVPSPGTSTRDASPRDQDKLDGAVTVVKFANEDMLYVLTTEAAYVFKRIAASGTTPERWERSKLPSPFGSSTSVLRTDIASDQPGNGPYGSAYMTLTRTGESSRQHHVYWFDGIDAWTDCNLEIDAPTNAVVADPFAGGVVYVGTDVGVFRGTRTFTPTGPGSWSWVHFSDGLPEAPVVDLVIDPRPEEGEPPMRDRVRLLRAALGGRGVWEIPTSRTARIEPALVVFVRAHDYDLRRSAIPASPKLPYPTSAPNDPRTALLVPADYAAQRLDASPDVRVRRAPGSAFPRLTRNGTTFSSTATTTGERTFAQMAVDVARRAATPGSRVSGIVKTESLSDDEWQELVTGLAAGGRRANVLPFRADPSGLRPDAADVAELVLDEPTADPASFCSCGAPNQPLLVDVLVHTRHYRSLSAARVKVALLAVPFSNATGTPTAAPLPAAWAVEVRADRSRTGAARGAWLATTTYRYADSATPIREVGRPIDARRAGVATFEVTLPAGTWLLVAVVMADDDTLDPATASLEPIEIARASRHVALRSVDVALEPKHHFFQEWHGLQAPQATYRGSTDDQRVVERRVVALLDLLPKVKLHLCTQESAVATFAMDVPSGDHFLAWEIVDPATGRVIATHPTFTPAAQTASAPASRITTGQYAWRWDGRDSAGLFVDAGTYASRVRVKDPTGAVHSFVSALRAEGDVNDVNVIVRPKGDTDLAAAIARAGQGPIDSNGQRIASDCDVMVQRGHHLVFVGHGTTEPTRAEAAPGFGAIAIPHERDFKAWIERPSASSRYEIFFQSSARSDGAITLRNATGPAPLNPRTSPAAARLDLPKIGSTGLDYVTDGLVENAVILRDTTGTCAAPAATITSAGTIRARNATYGTFGAAAGEDLAVRAPPWLNKQTKRNIPIDANDADGHFDAQTHPALSDCAPSIDEPLRMQPTLQQAVFGGFRAGTLPTTRAAASTVAGRANISLSIATYAAGSAYHVYHHAVGLAHTYSAAANELAISVPRKVIRGWNGYGRDVIDYVNGGRNVVVPGHVVIVWYVELVPSAGPAVVLASLIGTGPSTFGALPSWGRIVRSFTMPSPRPAGQVRSVFRYRLQLTPFGADHAWEHEGSDGSGSPIVDPFSSHAATIAEETVVGDSFEGSSIMVLP